MEDEDDLQPDSPPQFVEEIDVNELGVIEVRFYIEFLQTAVKKASFCNHRAMSRNDSKRILPIFVLLSPYFLTAC